MKRQLTIHNARPAAPTAPNTLEAFASLLHNAELASRTSKALIASGNRHGDLQVIRTSAKHIIEAADILIAQEQA